MSEKIQKILAGAGFGSRREVEQWLRDGRISVNGKTAILGERITVEAHVRIDGQEIRLNPGRPAKSRVLLYHKPEGEICSRHDPEERPTVFDSLPLLRNGRWVSIGRLDFNTSGVLLFTNDGELAHQLMHPSANIEREYAVRVQGQVTKEMLTALKKGVDLEDGPARFAALSDEGGEGSNHWYHVTVEQGRNRIVRRLFESQGVMVSRLIRIRFGSLTLPRLLRRGKWAELTLDQITSLLQPAEASLSSPHEERKKPGERHFSDNKHMPKKHPTAFRQSTRNITPAGRPARPGSRPSAAKRAGAGRPERDGGKPAFNKPFRGKREDTRVPSRPARPGGRPFAGKREGAERPERDSGRPGSRPFAGKREGSARPDRDGGRPAFNKPFRAKRDDAGPSGRPARPGSRPFVGKREGAARPERDGGRPAFNKPFRAKRDDAGPSGRPARPGSRPFAGKREGTARPERDAGRPTFNKPFRAKRDDAGPSGRPARPGSRPFAGKREGAARPERTNGKPGQRPQRHGKPTADRSTKERFSAPLSPRNKITRWEKYPSERPATGRPKAAGTGHRASPPRTGLQRRTPATRRPPAGHPILKLRQSRGKTEK